MKLVEFTDTNGIRMYINPDKVVYVIPSVSGTAIHFEMDEPVYVEEEVTAVVAKLQQK